MRKCCCMRTTRSVWHDLGGALRHAQILEEKHQLSFHLQQQRLIELIRAGKTEEALEFAQEYLAPRGEENPAFLEELGKGAPVPQPCAVGALVACGQPGASLGLHGLLRVDLVQQLPSLLPATFK